MNRNTKKNRRKLTEKNERRINADWNRWRRDNLYPEYVFGSNPDRRMKKERTIMDKISDSFVVNLFMALVEFGGRAIGFLFMAMFLSLPLGTIYITFTGIYGQTGSIFWALIGSGVVGGLWVILCVAQDEGPTVWNENPRLHVRYDEKHKIWKR